MKYPRSPRVLRCVAGAAVATLAAPGALAETRSIDGTGNNLSASPWGSASQQLLRFGPEEYGDGMNTMGGASRPNPRTISNAIFAQSGSMTNSYGLTDWVWQWGQFVDHDIDLTPVGGEFAPIIVPPGDPTFAPGSMIPFTRSFGDPTTGSDMSNPRQQMNNITSWIDGSNVYGSDTTLATDLRDPMGGGRLFMVNHSTGQLLPKDGGGQFLAGDERAGEQIGLTSSHTLFARQHNEWADQLAAANPGWSDEQLYQGARKIIGAQMQIITYNEWLPSLINTADPAVASLLDYTGYDDSVNPNVSNEFASALFRIGHTMLSPELRRLENDGNSIVEGSILLQDAFFNPTAIEDEGGISPVLKGLAAQQMQNIDAKIVDGVRNFLFEGGSGGLDLASLNINRGRDHGLCDYNTMRTMFGLPAVTSFSEITSDAALAAELEGLYGSVDDIDLWVGALSEDHASGAALGMLTQLGIAEQFGRLRTADRFYYEMDTDMMDATSLAAILDTLGMTIGDLEAIKLSDILRGVGEVENIQDNVFLIPTPGAGVALLAGIGLVSRRRRR